MRTITRVFNALCARLYVWAQVQITTEPVRVRAALMAALMAASTVLPALANERTDELLVGLGMTALTVLVGEGARARVTPADEK
ncbi:hypothetical protein GCM10009548_01890 [Streptomyces malaysiensis subsp. malaysiensis]|uniref:Holin n=1 Tax=Streptomyces malaysiensis TaxID=92644 RepID=A0ABX6W7H6_STRMQ|nr:MULTISPECIES: hypothetical protein [Streptomyces]QPI56346.1 hypothetical protein I1A49_16605 [Streptomyces solisilvae]UHH17833.1 hypothetical protein LUV23_16720 [Streptomyces sp. HNM0561]